MKIHIKKIVYIALSANGNEDAAPHVLNSREERWMKSIIKEDLGTAGISRLYRGAMLEVGDDVVWLEDFGYDVQRDPVLDAREQAIRARRVRRTEWKELV